MEFQEVVRRRRMVRQFAPEAVPEASIDRILGNTVRGPSAGFSQGQAFLVLRRDDLQRFWAVAGEAAVPSTQTAPLVIIPMSSKRVAVDEGLGACYFGIVPEAVGKVRSVFGIPADHEPIGAVAIGYDAETARRTHSRQRRPIAELVHYGNW